MQRALLAKAMLARPRLLILLAAIISVALPLGARTKESDLKPLLGQIESAEDELAVFDRLKMLSPWRADPGKRRELADDLIKLRQALMIHPDAEGAVLDDNASALRTMIAWRNDSDEKIDLLTALLEQEIERKRFESARRTQRRLIERLADRPDGDEERFSSILPLSARIDGDALERARGLVLRIDEAEPRLKALRLLAESALEEDRLGTAFKAFAGDDEQPSPDERAAMLSDFIELGAFEPAFFLALLIETDADRDRLLFDIIDHQIAQAQPPDTIIAQHAIINDDLRDGATLALIDDALDRNRMALARATSQRLVSDDALIDGTVKIGGRLTSEGYLEQASTLFDNLPDHLAARPAVLAERTRIDLRRGELGQGDALDQALARWAAHRQEPAMANLDDALAGALARAGRTDDLGRILDESEDPAERDALLDGLAMALGRGERSADGVKALDRIGDPERRAAAAIALLDGLGTGEDSDQGVVGDLIALIELALPEFADDREANGRIALALTQQLAAFRDFDDVEKAMAALSPDQRESELAQHALAVAETRDGRLLDAVRRLDRLPDNDARARMIIDVAMILVEDRRFGEAAALVDGIGDWSLRAKGYREIAERQASMQAPAGPIEQEIPEREKADAESVRADIPAVAPGRLHVTYLHYARYNENFASEVGEIELLREAQATRHPKYIYLEDGVFDLPAIAAALERQEAGDALERDGRLYTLRMPLLIGPAATLVISGSDVDALRMIQERAAYLINAGRLYLADSQLLGWSEAERGIATTDGAIHGVFRPFFLAWSNAETYIAGARVAGLGYRNDKSDGLFFAAGPSLLARQSKTTVRPPFGVVVDSVFEQMHRDVHAHDTNRLILDGNVFDDEIGSFSIVRPMGVENIGVQPAAAVGP